MTERLHHRAIDFTGLDLGGDAFAPAAGRPPRLVPYGVKLRGVNLVPKDSVGNPWRSLYVNWATKWGTVVKPQINAAASTGANAIRLIGDVDGVHNGALTVDAYVAAYEQFVDYCNTLGLWVYACLSDAGHWGGATRDQALTVMMAQAAMLESKPNVIGIDVIQEFGLNTGIAAGYTTHDFAAYIFGQLRTVTTLPLTCSVMGGGNGSTSQWSSSTITGFDDLFDFHDFHPYYDGMVAADLNPALAATSKPILLGEYGGSTSDSRLTAAAAVSALPRVIGSFFWAIVDNQSGDGGGLFTYDFAERATKTTIFRTVPDREQFPVGGPSLQDKGTTLPARGRVNFVGAGVTATDDATNDRTLVTIPGMTGLTVQDENGNVGVGVTQIDFQGLGVTATAGSSEVVVTIPGGGTGSGELLMQDGVTGPPVPLENEARSDWLYQG